MRAVNRWSSPSPCAPDADPSLWRCKSLAAQVDSLRQSLRICPAAAWAQILQATLLAARQRLGSLSSPRQARPTQLSVDCYFLLTSRPSQAEVLMCGL